jgi:hypothetical protein
LRPDIQRLVDYDRVHDIVDYQKRSYTLSNTLCFIGDITIAECNDRHYVIDGLHRLEAAKALVLLDPDYPMCVNIVDCQTEEAMKDVFITINKAQPVPEHVIRNSQNMPKRMILEEFRVHLRKTFKSYLSASVSPHRPNVYESNIIDHIDRSGIECSIPTGRLIFEYMCFVNIKYLSSLDSANAKRCFDKSEKHACRPLFISSDPDFKWLHNKEWIAEFLALQSTGNDPTDKSMTFVPITKGYKLLSLFHRKKKQRLGEENCPIPALPLVDVNSDFIPCSIFEGSKKGFEYRLGDKGIGYYKFKENDHVSNIEKCNMPIVGQRKAIPKQLRGVVWRSYYHTLDGECPLCTNKISLDDFECGHIISVKNGGGNSSDNLMPLCGKCNKSMSSMNLDEYCNVYGIHVKKTKQ